MRRLLTAILASIVVLSATPAAASDYTQTRYPILLVHGLFGFSTIGGIVDYFYQVPYNLERSGAKVYVASVSALNSSTIRGEQLASYINSLPDPKFNLFAHSQGAPTARVAASLVPGRIASITTIDGVNKGSKVADVIRGVIPANSAIEGGANALFNALGDLINLLSGSDNPQHSIAALDALTTPGTTDLNNALGWKGVNPNSCSGTSEDISIGGHDIKAFSWSGDAPYTNVLDLSDPVLALTSLAFNGAPNDGLVSSCESMFGHVINAYYDMNHLDAVNQILGIRSIWLNPISLYRQQANRLKNLGL